MPGVDPDKDVEITIDEGNLRICAERQEKENTRIRAGSAPSSVTGPSAAASRCLRG
jgi:HSP20 family protein